MPNTGGISGALIASPALAYQCFGRSAGNGRQTKETDGGSLRWVRSRPSPWPKQFNRQAGSIDAPILRNTYVSSVSSYSQGGRIQIRLTTVIHPGERWPMVMLTKQRITGMII